MRFLSALVLATFLSVQVVCAKDDVRLITEQDTFYASLLEDIAQAEEYVYLEYFVILDNELGHTFLEALARKAEEGVKTCVIYDAVTWIYNYFDSFSIGGFGRYSRRGVDVAAYNPFSPFPRNHSKLAVIDGTVAYVSSNNIKNSGSLSFAGIGRVKELAVRIEGDSVMGLREHFVDVWNKRVASGRELLHSDDAMGSGAIEAYSTVGLLGRTPERNYLPLINSSESRIRLATGYFIPTRKMVKAMEKAAARGVKVDLVIGEDSDLPFFLSWIPLRVAGRLSKRENIDVHIIPDTHIHVKAASFDDKAVMIGSTNLDYLSLRLNRELDVVFRMEEVTSDFIGYFDSLIRESR